MQHIAFIMDGNRRWAKKQGLMLTKSYQEGGAIALEHVIKFCLDTSITYLSLYAFSLENAHRSGPEKDALFRALLEGAVRNRESLIKESVAIRFVGKLELLPENVYKVCKDLEAATSTGLRLHINVLLFYGGQQEILNAARIVACDKSLMNADEETFKQAFERVLWSSPFPAPDLIVRTGGQQRLSNFLLYQSAYSELLFLEKLWPELTYVDCQSAYDFFTQTKRNFGK